MGDPGIGEGYVASFATYDAGAGETLYCAGSFGIPAGSFDGNIARWNGTNWDPVGGQLDYWATDMAVFNGELFVGGYFNSAGGAPGTDKVAKWNGSEWSGIDAQLESWQSSVWALKVFDDDGNGDDLYIAGNYLNIGGVGLDHIARWDGTAFTEVGGTIGGAVPLIVLTLYVHDDGTGPALYAGGRFITIAGVTVNHLAKWNGATWESVGGGVSGSGVGTGIHAMVTWDSGSGPDLYAAGHSFTSAGGVPALRIARWDGSAWHALGDGLDGTVEELVVYDDGDGEALYAFGSFTHSGAMPLNHVAKWDGTQWSAVGDGADDTIFDAILFDDGVQETIVAGGKFTTIDGQACNRIAQYVGCPTTGNPADINGDGVVDVLDLLAVLSARGPCPGCPEDVNGDGTVDVLDLLEVLANWS